MSPNKGKFRLLRDVICLILSRFTQSKQQGFFDQDHYQKFSAHMFLDDFLSSLWTSFQDRNSDLLNHVSIVIQTRVVWLNFHLQSLDFRSDQNLILYCSLSAVIKPLSGSFIQIKTSQTTFLNSTDKVNKQKAGKAEEQERNSRTKIN